MQQPRINRLFENYDYEASFKDSAMTASLWVVFQIKQELLKLIFPSAISFFSVVKILLGL